MRDGGISSSCDCDSVGISGGISGECGAKIRTAFEIAKDVYLLGKIGLHRVGVA